MARAILNEETASLPLLLHCIIGAVGRLDVQEVVESFISNGWNYRSTNNGASLMPRRRTESVLNEFEVTPNERVAINQKALGIREQGKGYTIRVGRTGAEVLRKCLIRYNEVLIGVAEAQLQRRREPELPRGVKKVDLMVTLPLDILRTLLGDNVMLLKHVINDERLSDEQFRGLAGIVLADFELVD